MAAADQDAAHMKLLPFKWIIEIYRDYIRVILGFYRENEKKQETAIV